MQRSKWFLNGVIDYSFSCNWLPEIEFDFKKLLTKFATFQMIFKWCNPLQYIGNRLPVYLNVEIQIQLWRVTTFHKMHCVIYYTFVVIDYQWTILKKKLRVITLHMVFSKVTTLPMVSLTRHEESIKVRPWLAFNRTFTTL